MSTLQAKMSMSYPKAQILQLSYDGDTNKSRPIILPIPKNKPPCKITACKTSPRKELGVSKRSEDKLLNTVISAISIQSQQLCLNEELWKVTKNQKHLVESCMTPSGRNTGTTDSYPTIDKIKAWSDEKKFWLSYLPRQRRIYDYESGKSITSDSYDTIPGENQNVVLTGEPISFDERCRRYNKQVEWEEKVMTQFDKKHQVRNDRLRNRELALTLHRYKDFTKSLVGNLKDTQAETIQLGSGRNRMPKRYQQSEMERIEQGYNILKDLYALNPPLVIQLATQHVKGPPGKRWMGLSRDDISEVLEHLANGHADPNYCPFPGFNQPFQGRDHRTGAYSIRDYLSSSRNLPTRNELMSFKIPPCSAKTKESTRQPQVIMRKMRCQGQKRNLNRPLKPHQLMPLHVPGPDRLHQNICVRPYSAEMDGPDSDVDGNTKPMSTEGWARKKKLRPLTPKDPKGLVEDELNNVVATLAESEVESLDYESGDEDEGITIESFIPGFVNSH